jgi:hypothetical protein
MKEDILCLTNGGKIPLVMSKEILKDGPVSFVQLLNYVKRNFRNLNLRLDTSKLVRVTVIVPDLTSVTLSSYGKDLIVVSSVSIQSIYCKSNIFTLELIDGRRLELF